MAEKLASPLLPLKTKIFISLLSAVTDAARRNNGTVNRRLLSCLDFRARSNPKPFKGVKTADFTVDPTRNLWFRAFYPTGTADDVSLPVIVFFHGGGFAFLSPDSKAYDAVCRRIASEIPAVVVSVNYRLSPENKYPAQYDDGFDVVRWLDGRDQTFYDFAPKADVSRLFLSGDSAGGNISHHVAKRISGAPPSEFQRVRLIGLVAIQPYFGGEERTGSEIRLAWAPLVSKERTDWLWKAFLPEGSDRDHEAVNPFGRNRSGDLPASFPATLVFVGGFDPLQDWQKRYYEGLKALGKEAKLMEYPNAIHAFYVFPELPESELLITEMRDFIQKQSRKVAEMK